MGTPSYSRVECLKADKGVEYVSNEHKGYCIQLGVVLEYASTNTPSVCLSALIDSRGHGSMSARRQRATLVSLGGADLNVTTAFIGHSTKRPSLMGSELRSQNFFWPSSKK